MTQDESLLLNVFNRGPVAVDRAIALGITSAQLVRVWWALCDDECYHIALLMAGLPAKAEIERAPACNHCLKRLGLMPFTEEMSLFPASREGRKPDIQPARGPLAGI